MEPSQKLAGNQCSVAVDRFDSSARRRLPADGQEGVLTCVAVAFVNQSDFRMLRYSETSSFP